MYLIFVKEKVRQNVYLDLNCFLTSRVLARSHTYSGSFQHECSIIVLYSNSFTTVNLTEKLHQIHKVLELHPASVQVEAFHSAHIDLNYFRASTVLV